MGKYFKYVGGLDDPTQLLKRILITFIIIVIAFILYRIISYFINKYVKDGKKGSFITRVVRLIIILIAIFFVFRAWLHSEHSLLIAIGILFAIVSLSLKDLIVNIAAWAYILSTKIINHGDRIEIDGVKGDVHEIDLFQIYILEMGNILDSSLPSGRIVSIPNKFIFEKKVYNYSRNSDFIWQEAYVTIPFDYDREKALKVAGQASYDAYLDIKAEFDDEKLESLEKMSDLMDSTEKPLIRADYDVNGVRIYVRYFTHYDDTGKNKSRMQFALYDAFTKNNIPMIHPKWFRDIANE